MALIRSISIAALILSAGLAVFSQTPEPTPGNGGVPEYIKASPTFAELILRKAVVEAELEELLVRYTEEYPKVVEKRFEMSELDKEQDGLLKIPESESSKLTLALGKLLVQRATYATDLGLLKLKYPDTNTEVIRAKKKLEIFDKAIKRIL